MEKEKSFENDTVFLRLQIISSENVKINRIVEFIPDGVKEAVYFPMITNQKNDNGVSSSSKYGLAYIAYIPKEEKKNDFFIKKKEVNGLTEGFVFIKTKNFDTFLGVETIFNKFYPSKNPKTGIYSLYAENPFMMAALLLFIENYSDYIERVVAEKPAEVEGNPGFVGFYRDFLEAIEGEEIEDPEGEAKKIWKSMSEDEQKIYGPEKINIFNLSPDQTNDTYISDVKLLEKENAINYKLKISQGQYLCNSELDKDILEELTQEGKIVDSTNHFSVVATEMKALDRNSEAKLKVRSNKINWTRERDGDPFDVFVHKPILAKYDINETEKINRTIEVYFLNKEQRDKENQVFRQLDNDSNTEFVYHQVQIFT